MPTAQLGLGRLGGFRYSDACRWKFPHHHAVKLTRYAVGERLELLPLKHQETIKFRSRNDQAPLSTAVWPPQAP
jgi:hypothetical protein